MHGIHERRSTGERQLRALIQQAQRSPSLRSRIASSLAWSASLKLIGPAAMARLNSRYRGKAYATDVLSFPAPQPILQATGYLGELVICTSVLKSQARAEGHTEAAELKILLAHGLLHLLGFDHERSPREAAAQARWERRLLGLRGRPGLIARGL